MDKEFKEIINEIAANKTVKEMEKYRQHFNTTCYEHCYKCAYISYKIAKFFHLDYYCLTRAAMLHDLFLYDWRIKDKTRKGHHAFTHANQACENALKIFSLTPKEQSIIKTHMFPVTPIPPSSIEGLILTLVDKYCAIIEIKSIFKKRDKK